MIETERLLIKPYEEADAPAFYINLYQNREHLMDDFSKMVNMAQTTEAVKEYLGVKQQDWEAHKAYACGIFLKSTQELIGHISVRDIEWKVPKGELAYFIIQAHTGNNYAVEALTAFREWCFRKRFFQRLYMRIAVANKASCRVAEKAGFREEGLLIKDYRRRGVELTDMKMFGYTE